MSASCHEERRKDGLFPTADHLSFLLVFPLSRVVFGRGCSSMPTDTEREIRVDLK